MFLVTFGILGFVVGGVHPLLGARGGMLLAFRVDAAQSIIHLVLGALLLQAARTGAAVRPAPWLLAGSVCATIALRGLLGPAGAPLVPLAANVPDGVLHAAVAVLALLAAVAVPRTGEAGRDVPGQPPGRGAPRPARGQTASGVASSSPP
jgi:hypothetical protein